MASDTTTQIPLPSINQTYTTRPVSWAGWKRLKGRILQTLASEQVAELIALAVMFYEAGLDSLDKLPQEKLGGLPSLASAISDRLDDITEDIVNECVVDEVQWDGLSTPDVMRLREAALAASDLPDLLAMEKNSWAGLVGNLIPSDPAPINGSETSSTTTGGPDGTPTSSPGDTPSVN